MLPCRCCLTLWRVQRMLTNTEMYDLGNRLRELRNAADLSLREMARQLGDVTAAHLSDIEFGRRYPSDTLLSKLAELFEVSPDELRMLDSRPPINEIKRAARQDPQYGFAFRQLMDRNLTAQELLALIEQDSSNQEDE